MTTRTFRRAAGVISLAVVVTLVAACGGDAGPSEPSGASAATPPPAASATEAPAATETPGTTATPSSGSGEQDDLIARGKVIFETAGGVGCIACHGPSGLGDGAAGVGAPNIRAATKAQIQGALAGGVPLMTFIELTPAEIDAVLAYIKTFGKDDM